MLRGRGRKQGRVPCRSADRAGNSDGREGREAGTRRAGALPDAEEYLPPRAGDALRALLERLDEARVVVRHRRRLEHALGDEERELAELMGED